jgi:hypothetical protein
MNRFTTSRLSAALARPAAVEYDPVTFGQGFT